MPSAVYHRVLTLHPPLTKPQTQLDALSSLAPAADHLPKGCWAWSARAAKHTGGRRCALTSWSNCDPCPIRVVTEVLTGLNRAKDVGGSSRRRRLALMVTTCQQGLSQRV